MAEATPDDCYCRERDKLGDLLAELPIGFCGTCSVCGRPGHTRAHPHLPTTDAWCDEHWRALVAQRVRLHPGHLVSALVLGLALYSLSSLVRACRG